VRLGSQQTMQAGTAQLNGMLRSGSAPVVSAGALRHAASYVTTAPVAPGQLITVFGSNLAERARSAEGYPLPSTLEGTEVVLGGMLLPLMYSSEGQVNAQVPYGLTSNTQHQVLVRRGNALSVPESFTVAVAQPGVFSKNMQGTGQGVIVKADRKTLAEPGTPAKRGETVTISATGLGQVTPEVKAGELAPEAAPQTVNPVAVTIGGLEAEVVFAGLAPGTTGLYQVQVVVPEGVPAGDDVPVVVSVAGQVSNTVAMAVQ
jgi:uncharacterized protein (TIGR03437 family)